MADLIDRDETIRAIKTWPKYGHDGHCRLVPWKEGLVPYVHLDDVITAVYGMPSAESERKTGKWKQGYCSICGEHAPFWPMATTYYLSKFCPNCGAKMEEVKQ